MVEVCGRERRERHLIVDAKPSRPRGAGTAQRLKDDEKKRGTHLFCLHRRELGEHVLLVLGRHPARQERTDLLCVRRIVAHQ